MRSLYILFVCAMLIANTACAGSPVHVDMTVVGNDGNPVDGAKVGMGFLLAHDGNSFKGVTDADGHIEATERAAFGVKISAKKQGYYDSRLRTGRGDQKLTLVLLEKKNPIAMYAKDIKFFPQVLDEEFGYDLMKGDYVAPYGDGVVSDFILKIHYQEKNFLNYRYFLTIRFSNPNDGLVPFYVTHLQSEYQSDYSGPATGYIGEWDFKEIRMDLKPDDTNFDKKRNYYFRVRTAVNKDGEIESAHYGKIYGEFPDINYYFNPTPNDRNVEFDPDRNLFKNLESGEYVLEP